jgi:hypothetical protein
MWKLPPMSADASYVLCFCQDSSERRFCAVVESSATHPFEVARTAVIPKELLRTTNDRAIAQQYKLLPHELGFDFGPHGEWFTKPEIEALFGKASPGGIPWLNGRTPNLPPA